MSQIAVNAFRAALVPRHLQVPDAEIATALNAAFATMYGVRRPVAAIRTGLSEDPVVVCDDGTLWREDFGSWRELLPPLPGTVATGGGIASPLHTKLGQIRAALDLPGATTEWFVALVRKILDAPSTVSPLPSTNRPRPLQMTHYGVTAQGHPETCYGCRANNYALRLTDWCNGVSYETYRFNFEIATAWGLHALEYWLLATGAVHSGSR